MREHRGGTSAEADRLLRLAAHLPERERSLVRSVYADGLSVQRVSVLCGAPANLVRAKLRRIVMRLRRPEFVLAARAQGDERGARGRRSHRANAWAWPADLRAVARLCILEDVGIRAAAERLGMSVHAVRSRRAAIVAMGRTESGRGRIAHIGHSETESESLIA